MLVRRGNSNDADVIISHQLAMALETENRELNESDLSQGVYAIFADPLRGFYIVAEEMGKVIGNLMITTEWSDWTNRWVWWIQSVYVQPAHRQKGTYRSLYQHVKELAKKQNVKIIRLYVDQDNKIAMQAYENLGMKGARYRMYEESIE